MKPGERFSGSCYQHFDASFQADRAIALRMSEGRDFYLEAVPTSLRGDREIVRNAIKSRAENIKHLPSELADDLAFLKELSVLNDGILYHLPDEVKARLFTTTVNSVEHRGRTITYRMVLDDGYVQDQQLPVRDAEVKAGDRVLVRMANFPVLTYEEDGPVGSYLTVRYLNNFVLTGDFVFFVKANSGEQTFTNWLSGDPRYTEPQPNDDFLKHSVYLVPETASVIQYADLSLCPRIYFGRRAQFPVGIQLFPSADSYREAVTVSKQEKTYGRPAFTRINETTLQATPVAVAEVAGAARVFVDGHGWRFLIPHRDGALAALATLKATSDRDDWVWLKAHSGSITDAQKKLLLEHFETVDFRDEVKAHLT
jgi:hypothetical protein